MKKVAILTATAGILALGWGGIVFSVMNDEPVEIKDKVVHVDAVETTPQTVAEPVHEVLEPETVEVPVVQNKPVEKPQEPEHPKACPPGSYDIGIRKNNEPLCRLEPTGCPHGDSIPLEYCVKE